MKIKVKGFFNIKDVMGSRAPLEMDVQSATIREVLEELSRRFGEPFIKEMFAPETKELKPENQVLVNGRHYRYLEKGLDSELRDGDLLALFPAVAGG